MTSSDDIGLEVDRVILEQLREVARAGDRSDPLWPMVADIARQVLAKGGVPAAEIEEAMRRQREAERLADDTPDQDQT